MISETNAPRTVTGPTINDKIKEVHAYIDHSVEVVHRLRAELAEVKAQRDRLADALRPFAKFACDPQPATCACFNCKAAVALAAIGEKT